MAKTEEEIEVKFLVPDLAAVAARIESLGGSLSAGRVFEVNLRFDLPDGSLSRAGRVLRLRRDAGMVMTFKGPARPGEEVSARREIEFEVGDFEAARRLLEALGYQVAVVYEKYRTTYRLDPLTVTLDEMPFGSFVEIEGPDAGTIRSAAVALQLDWEARSTASYLGLFQKVRTELGLPAQHLTFVELKEFSVTPQDLGLRLAQQPQA